MILFTYILPITFTIAHHSTQSLWSAINTAVGKNPLDLDISRQHQSVIATFRLNVTAFGFIGFVSGLILAISNMDDPKSLPTNVAHSMLNLLYAFMVSELLIAPLLSRLQRRTLDSSNHIKHYNKVQYTVHLFPILYVLYLILSLTTLMVCLVRVQKDRFEMLIEIMRSSF